MKNFFKAIIIIIVIFIIIIAGWFIMYSKVNKNSLPDEVNTFTLTYTYNYVMLYDKDNYNTDITINKIYLNGENAKTLLSYIKLMTKGSSSNYDNSIENEIATLVLDDSITINVYKDHIYYKYNDHEVYLTITKSFIKELKSIYKDRNEDIYRKTDDSYVPFSYEELKDFDISTYDLTNKGYYETTDTEGNKVLIITSGTKPNGCYGLEILSSNIDDKDNVTIKMHDTNSSDNDKFIICTLALVYPNVVIKLSGEYQNITIKDTNNEIYNKLG